MEENKTYFGITADLSSLDEKLQKFVVLRNELVLLAEEIGFDVKSGILVLEKK